MSDFAIAPRTNVVSGEALADYTGYQVDLTGASSTVMRADGYANQAVAQRAVTMLLLSAGASAEDVARVLADFGGLRRHTIGTGGAIAGDQLVLEYDTGKLISVRANAEITLNPGDRVLGYALETITADTEGWILYVGQFGQTPQGGGYLAATLTGATTLSVAQEAVACLDLDPGGAGRTVTFAAAADRYATGWRIGEQRTKIIRNTADAAELITWAAGTGNTIRVPQDTGTSADYVADITQAQLARVTYMCDSSTAFTILIERFLADA